MSTFTNNGTLGTLFGREDQPHLSYVPTGVASNTSSWPSTAFLDPPFSVDGGDVWPCDQYLDEARPGPLLGAPDGNGSGMNLLMKREVAAPMLERAIPIVQRALPAFQPRPPLNWTQAPCPPWQPTPSWDHPVHTTRQHNGHSSPIGSLAMRPDIAPFQLAASSVITGQSERRVMQTGFLPPIPTPHSVRLSTHNDPVPVVPFTPRPRGERWDLSLNTTAFRCLWTSGVTRCTALIVGDRRSVTSHLRKAHDFTCDGQMIACAWGECTACMQRRNIPRHIVACHFEIKVTCSQCGLALSRADANKKHRLACTGAKMPAVVVEAAEEDDGRLVFSGVGALSRTA